MTFFNKQQDVLKIELTPYGRSLLSNGKLMPKYYAFFDDDIVYDSSCLSFHEEQYETKVRIVNETPRIRPQRDMESVERILRQNERTEDGSRPHSNLLLNYLTEPLGTSDGTEDQASSWNFTAIHGEIDSIEQTSSNSGSYLRQIPQINMTLEYTMQVRNTDDDSPVTGRQSSYSTAASRAFQDGTYLEVLDEQILARILEENGFTFKDGLEMEAYIYETEGGELRQLKMTPKTEGIVNGFLIDTVETTIDIDHSYLEYWMSIFYDEQISNSDLCKGISKLKKEDILLDIEVECEDDVGVDFDIYRSRVTDVERC